MSTRVAAFFIALLLVRPSLATAPSTAPASDLQAKVAAIAKEVLASTGTPAASIAIVQEGKLVLAEAYGSEQLAPRTPARPETRFGIGSISKQFLVAAIMLLAEEKKLSLDDPVARFLPDLPHAKEVTIRQLLAHTSGYQDHWPQDYLPAEMKGAIRPAELARRWAERGLDFAPGTRMQYSNTGFIIAGLIIEQVSGMPLYAFFEKRLFAPLGLTGVVDLDGARPAGTATGYTRFLLGPHQPAPIEGQGWIYACGSLGMAASELARWDLAVIDQKLLTPASWKEMATEQRLQNGLGTNYGLGLGLGRFGEHRQLSHDGEISGFLAINRIYPDDRAAIVVLTNDDIGDSASAIADKIQPLLFEQQDKKQESQARAQRILADLAKGTIDRSLFSENGNGYFSAEAVRDYAASLKQLGAPTEVEQKAQRLRGGMMLRLFEVQTSKKKTLAVVERDLADGRIEQFIVTEKK